jgi:prepilin-type N-terminal cleavage/methylation domain-containing protein
LSQLRTHNGFTLIELILVIVIIGVLVGVAVQNGGQLYTTAKIEETKLEMDALAVAITGNPTLENNGVRSDFGYVGDVGSMPPNLGALYANPGGYTTWNGPYVANRFTQVADDYNNDAFGASYAYSGGATITSTGSGADIVRRVTNSTDDLLYNSLSGNVADADGSPPGRIYDDSIAVLLTIPNGNGGMATVSSSVDPGGYFEFDSLPVGNHDLQIVYQPNDDTLRRFVSIVPNSAVHANYRLASNVWYAGGAGGGGGGGGGAVTYIAGSETSGGAHHDHMSFDIQNTSGSPVTINSIVATYSTSPAAFYGELKWDGTKLWKDDNDQRGTGEILNFADQILAAGATVTVELKRFREPRNGNTKFDIRNTDFTVTFSNGDVVTLTVPGS